MQTAELGELVHLNAAESGGGTGSRLPLRSLRVLCLFKLGLLVGRGLLLGVLRFRVMNRATGDDGGADDRSASHPASHDSGHVCPSTLVLVVDHGLELVHRRVDRVGGNALVPEQHPALAT